MYCLPLNSWQCSVVAKERNIGWGDKKGPIKDDLKVI